MRKWSELPAFCRVGVLGCLAVFLAGHPCQVGLGQDPNIHVDPATGMRYQRKYRTVQKPVTETKMESKVVTISRPEVVTETEPVVTTYYAPVVRHAWQPRWKGLWNPFSPATLTYEFVPQTNWEARSETVHRLRTSTRWVSEQKVVQEPKLVTAMQENQEEYWVAIGPDPNFRSNANGANTYGSNTYGANTYGAPGNGFGSGTQVASLPSTSPSPSPAVRPTRPEISGGMPPTVLDPYNTRTYSTTPKYR